MIRFNTIRLPLIASLMLGGFATVALAEVNQAVKDACREDYHTHCDKMEVGSEELRTCMRASATKISIPCLKALVENNEVTKEDIERYYEETQKKAKSE
jgi:hypothetical protein